jgi:hypothetical protein
VQSGQDDLDPEKALERVQVDRHPAGIVGHADPVIGLQGGR